MRNPKTRLSERLARSNREALFGRERELALLEAQLAPEGAVVTFVHGAGGIGKTSLLAAAMPRLEELGALVVTLDARSIAPTARAFLAAVRAKVGVEPFGVHDLQEEVRDAEDIRALAQVLEREPAPHAFLVDEFDNLRLLDDWLRREFLPELPERTRWVFAGRFGPRAAWLTTPGWSRAVVSLKLEPLDEAAARTLLLARGVPEEEVARLTRLARGTPLALTLVTAKSEAEPTVNENAVLAALAERSVQALPLALREALEAASVVRRVTRDMLVELLGAAYDESLLDELSQLSFVEHAEDGLVLHETVRHAVASRLRALDPSRHQRLRQSASAVIARALDSQPKPRSGAWRLLADMLFLSDEPGLREAFFPTRDNGAAVMDAALASDHAPLRALVERNDEGPWLEVFEAWWQHAPKCFRVVRGSHGALLGFSLVVPSGDIPRALTSEDPLLGAWQADLAASPGGDRGALFMRRALAAQGETEEATRSLIWLDVKRSYVERPEQWALYVATREAERELSVLARLGFRRVALEHAGEATIQLRFGEKGVWGWLRDLIQGSNRDLFQGDNRDLVQGSNSPELRSVEPGDPRGTSVPSWHLEEAQRALVIVGERQPLSALEYRALSYLLEQAGRVVTREQLLAAAWEQSYSGSNVVDALIRLLRKKLGPFAGDLETVRGHGYRLSRSGRRADVT